MLKLGVHRPDQYALTRGGLRAALRRGHVDYRLLRTGNPASALEIDLFESVMLRMQLADGVFRKTSPRRFNDLDAWVRPLLAAEFSRSTPLDVHDWAASDCSTSAVWHESLIEEFPQVRMTASDTSLHLVEMQVRGNGSYVFEASGRVLQYIAAPFVIRLSPSEPAPLIVNRMLARRAMKRLEALRREHAIDPAAVVVPDDGSAVENGPLTFRRIPLIHPRAEALRRAATTFRIERHSVFDPASTPVQIIRTMNILNTAYFPPARLARGIRSVFESLVPGGVWIVGRTVHDGPCMHHVSVLRREAGGLRVITRYNEKSEIEDLAVAGVW